MKKRGILFDQHEESDVDYQKNMRKHVFEEASPFHDDHNDERLDDSDPLDTEVLMDEEGELLFSLGPDEPEPTAEAVTREKGRIKRKSQGDPSRMMRRMAVLSGHQCGYKTDNGEPLVPQKDFVEERRKREKRVRQKWLARKNRKLELQGYRWPDDWKDRPERTVAMNREEAAKGIGKPVPFFLKTVARRIGADPTALRWPRYMNDLTNKQISNLCDKVKAKKMTAAVFNFVVPQLDPMEQFRMKRPKITLKHVFRDGEPAVIPAIGGSSIRRVPESLPEWSQPFVNNPVEMPSGITDHTYCKDPMEFGLIMSEEWMEKVERGEEVLARNRRTGEMEPVVTHCVVTGSSLVRQREGSGVEQLGYWLLAPNLWGMSVKAARVAVTAAGVEAGLLEGQVNYPAGEEGEHLRQVVKGLVDNPDAWCVMAVAVGSRTEVPRTNEKLNKYPPLREQAADILKLRDFFFFGMTDEEIDEHQRELKKLQRRFTEFGAGK